MSKVFYEYYRKKNGNLKGIVLAVDKGIYGWALCDRKDRFSKGFALFLATTRALKAMRLSPEDRQKFYTKVPQTLKPLFNKIEERAKRYYKEPQNPVEDVD